MEAQIDASRFPPGSLSVLPFTVAERDTLLTPLGFGIADLLVVDLAKSPRLQLLERDRLHAIMRELDLIDQGNVDPRVAPRVGRLVGASRVVVGNLSSGGPGELVISARVVDVAAGTVAQVVSARAPLVRFFDAQKAVAFQVFEQLGIALTPAQRARVEQTQTTDLAALVAYGQGVEADARGDAARAALAYEEATRLDAAFSVARGVRSTGSPTASGTRVTGVQRILELSSQAINAPAANRVADAADLPLSSSQVLTLLLTIRVF